MTDHWPTKPPETEQELIDAMIALGYIAKKIRNKHASTPEPDPDRKRHDNR